MILENIEKLQSAIPSLEGFDIKTLTFEQLCELINSLENSSEILDNITSSDEDTAVADIAHEEENIKAEKKEEESINPNHEDGTPKSKQEIADEKWELKQKRVTKQVDKFVAKVNESTAFVNKCIQEISKYGTIIVSILNVSMYIDELYKQLNILKAKIEGSGAWVEIQYYIQLIKLKIKKVILQVKQKLSQWEKAMWYAFYNGKCCAAMAASQAWLAGIAASVEAIMTTINKILSMIPDMLSVAAEGMSFFITPKSLQATHIPIYNLHKSIGNILSDVILTEIEQLCSQSKSINLAAKGAQIGANVALSQRLGEVLTWDKIQVNLTVPSVETIIRKAVDLIISLIPFANPLPKIEKLNMATNPGYLLFLASGWCRAGQIAFGLPGYMMGSPVTPMEYTEE